MNNKIFYSQYINYSSEVHFVNLSSKHCTVSVGIIRVKEARENCTDVQIHLDTTRKPHATEIVVSLEAKGSN